jgi:hypothetical protein
MFMSRLFQRTSMNLAASALFAGGLLLTSSTTHALPSHLKLITFEGDAQYTDPAGGVEQDGYSLLPTAGTGASLEWQVSSDTYFKWTQESTGTSERWELTENDGDHRFNVEGVSVYNNEGSGILFQGFVGDETIPSYTYTLPAGLTGGLDFEAMFGGWFGLKKFTIEAAAPLVANSDFAIDNIWIKHSIPDGGSTARLLGLGVLVMSSVASRRKA